MKLTKLLYRYSEAANLLSCSNSTIRRLVDEGKLVRVFHGTSTRSARITADSLDSYVSQIEQRKDSIVHPA